MDYYDTDDGHFPQTAVRSSPYADEYYVDPVLRVIEIIDAPSFEIIDGLR